MPARHQAVRSAVRSARPTWTRGARGARGAPGAHAAQGARRAVRTAMTVAAVSYVTVAVTLTLQQGSMIFLPDPSVPAIATVLPGGEARTARTADGIDHTVWYLPPPAGVADSRCAAPAVLVLHGTGGNRSGLAALAPKLARQGMGVLLAEYRGYGESPGRPTEDGLALDAEAALAVLRHHPSVDPDRVAYLGESLGTGVATRLATTDPPRALVLRSPYTSIADVAAVRTRIFPTRLLVHEHFATIDRIGSVAAPVLVVTGSADTLIPVEQSRAVFTAAAGPKQWRLFDGLIHEDPMWAGGDAYVEEVAEFLREPLQLGRCP